MSLHHYIIAFLYPFKRVLYFVKKYLFRSNNYNELRVLLFHDIPEDKHSKFYKKLNKLSKSWNFISPKEFSDILEKRKILKGRNLLLTFDDGYISNRIIAKKFLNPLGIKAIFFVIQDFIGIKNRSEARKYVSSNIYPSLKYSNVPKNYYNMNWKHLKELVKEGHSIGAHTKSHKKLSEIKTKTNLIKEIVESADYIEKMLNVSIEHFAFPFGNRKSFSKKAFLVAKERFNFIFSGIRGDNNKISKENVIFRDSINMSFSYFLTGSFLEGSSDFYYKNDMIEINSWIN
jgi:peptidoglycan/xylan/chitin deacetylase (PgdA/CDA1 family)